MWNPQAIGNGRSLLSADDPGANRKVQLVDQPLMKQSGVQLAATFAEEPLYFPSVTEMPQRQSKIDLALSTNKDFVRERTELFQDGFRGALGGEDNEGGKAVLKNCGGGIDGA